MAHGLGWVVERGEARGRRVESEREESRTGKSNKKCHRGSYLILRSFWAFYIGDSICRYMIDLMIVIQVW